MWGGGGGPIVNMHLGRPACALRLLPEALCWVKDDTGRYVGANAAFLRFSGLAQESSLIGCRDQDLVPADLSQQYFQDDDRVRVTGRAITHQVELVQNAAGVIAWHMCTKRPVLGYSGKPIATAGTMCPLEQALSVFPASEPLGGAVRQMVEGFTDDISVELLAESVGLSPSHFTRRFKQLFQVTPHQFLLRIRIQVACQMLVRSNRSIVQIALGTRFYDQSHFVRQFSRQMQISPRAYRQRFRSGGNPQSLAFFHRWRF